MAPRGRTWQSCGRDCEISEEDEGREATSKGDRSWSRTPSANGGERSTVHLQPAMKKSPRKPGGASSSRQHHRIFHHEGQERKEGHGGGSSLEVPLRCAVVEFVCGGSQLHEKIDS